MGQGPRRIRYLSEFVVQEPAKCRYAPSDPPLLSAGCILHAIQSGKKSPEARLAESAFAAGRGDLKDFVLNCSSGRELLEKGFGEDVEIALQLNACKVASILVEGRYIRSVEI